MLFYVARLYEQKQELYKGLPPSWPNKNWQRLGTTPNQVTCWFSLGLTLGVTPTSCFSELAEGKCSPYLE